jgi:hypothetical protein
VLELEEAPGEQQWQSARRPDNGDTITHSAPLIDAIRGRAPRTRSDSSG